mmetsp:Transcript_12633/g.21308  ORF Transcript_12633/g.21308 Transcript_12633/m.21308 type:complete len:1019 (+) Transcript_12633:93-3149(+)
MPRHEAKVFRGLLFDLPVSIDCFNAGRPDVNIFFLSHFHKDHYNELNSTFSGTIYCSSITRDMIIAKLGVSPSRVEALQESITTSIPVGNLYLSVETFDANHCAGGVMFLFHGPFGRVLHTGDFRFDYRVHADVIAACNSSRGLDALIMDCTYVSCNSNPSFPPKESSISEVIAFIDREPGDAMIGMIAYVGTEIFMPKSFSDRAQFLSIPNIAVHLTEDNSATRFSLVSDSMAEESLLRITASSARRNCIIIKASTNYFLVEGNRFEASKHESINMNIHRVLFSMHSSLNELKEFVRHIRPHTLFISAQTCKPEQRQRAATAKHLVPLLPLCNLSTCAVVSSLCSSPSPPPDGQLNTSSAPPSASSARPMKCNDRPLSSGGTKSSFANSLPLSSPPLVDSPRSTQFNSLGPPLSLSKSSTGLPSNLDRLSPPASSSSSPSPPLSETLRSNPTLLHSSAISDKPPTLAKCMHVDVVSSAIEYSKSKNSSLSTNPPASTTFFSSSSTHLSSSPQSTIYALSDDASYPPSYDHLLAMEEKKLPMSGNAKSIMYDRSPNSPSTTVFSELQSFCHSASRSQCGPSGDTSASPYNDTSLTHEVHGANMTLHTVTSFKASCITSATVTELSVASSTIASQGPSSSTCDVTFPTPTPPFSSQPPEDGTDTDMLAFLMRPSKRRRGGAPNLSTPLSQPMPVPITQPCSAPASLSWSCPTPTLPSSLQDSCDASSAPTCHSLAEKASISQCHPVVSPSASSSLPSRAPLLASYPSPTQATSFSSSSAFSHPPSQPTRPSSPPLSFPLPLPSTPSQASPSLPFTATCTKRPCSDDNPYEQAGQCCDDPSKNSTNASGTSVLQSFSSNDTVAKATAKKGTSSAKKVVEEPKKQTRDGENKSMPKAACTPAPIETKHRQLFANMRVWVVKEGPGMGSHRAGVLEKMITVRGGEVVRALSTKPTHIVTSLTPDKILQVLHLSRLPERLIVLSDDWVKACVADCKTAAEIEQLQDKYSVFKSQLKSNKEITR